MDFAANAPPPSIQAHTLRDLLSDSVLCNLLSSDSLDHLVSPQGVEGALFSVSSNEFIHQGAYESLDWLIVPVAVSSNRWVVAIPYSDIRKLDDGSRDCLINSGNHGQHFRGPSLLRMRHFLKAADRKFAELRQRGLQAAAGGTPDAAHASSDNFHAYQSGSRNFIKDILRSKVISSYLVYDMSASDECHSFLFTRTAIGATLIIEYIFTHLNVNLGQVYIFPGRSFPTKQSIPMLRLDVTEIRIQCQFCIARGLGNECICQLEMQTRGASFPWHLISQQNSTISPDPEKPSYIEDAVAWLKQQQQQQRGRKNVLSTTPKRPRPTSGTGWQALAAMRQFTVQNVRGTYHSFTHLYVNVKEIGMVAVGEGLFHRRRTEWWCSNTPAAHHLKGVCVRECALHIDEPLFSKAESQAMLDSYALTAEDESCDANEQVDLDDSGRVKRRRAYESDNEAYVLNEQQLSESRSVSAGQMTATDESGAATATVVAGDDDSRSNAALPQ